ncbi:DHHW family protein [Tissierella carlieri]|jgi:hypothetical protein|uniref:DHHW family protein n=1 Tax=Tissierella carlieri TaxID=689904 RepID=UPI00386323AA
MKSLKKYYLTVSFLLIIYLGIFMTIITEDEKVSILENRTLANAPFFTRESLLSGEYFKGWETYLTDHIYSRDYWIEKYIFLNMSILNKSDINKIVMAKEGNLLPFIPFNTNHDLKFYSEKINTMANNIGELDKYIREYGGHFLFVGIPEQASYLRSKYPDYYRNNEEYLDNNETTMFEALKENKIDYINMAEKYRQDVREDYYFKTDHHYTFRGAYKAYTEIIQNLIDKVRIDNIRLPLAEDEIDFITLSNPILGSRNRKLAYLYPTDEKIEIGYPIEKISYEKFTNGQLDPDFYQINKDNDGRPTYNVFMGGDHAETVIKTNRKDLPNLLIFGDSFTNAMEPLLYYHFNETRILDLRHYKDKSLYDYIKEHKPDIVLMIRDDLNYGTLEGNGKFD